MALAGRVALAANGRATGLPEGRESERRAE
jgi:hypothetical protein